MSSQLSAPDGGDLPPNIGELLLRPYQALLRHIHGRLAQAGYPDIRPAHSSVFQYLLSGGLRLTELADRAQLTKQSIGYLVDSLEAFGYVERVPDPRDARAKIIRLTPRGWATVPLVRQFIQEVETEWAHRLGEEEYRLVRQQLERLLRLS